MKVLRRSRRLARLAGCTALALGMAGTAGAVSAPSQDAQARVTATLIQSHVVASWGLNTEGELGDGSTTTRGQYGDVRAGNDVVQVAAGMVHALAVRSDGTVWAWGSNGHGELGDGTQTDRSEPVQVAGLTGITRVTAGAFFSLALRSDGTVWAWGANQNGQLGRKTVTDHEVTPARVAVLNHVTKIAAGHDFALALRSDGIVFAWGRGQLGQLGNGTTADSPVPVKIAGLSRVTGIAAGWEASLATENDGISALTSVWAWGGNEYGELGDGTTAGHATPERVTGIPAYVAGASAGAGFAAVLGTDGSVWDWGANGLGQLGVAPESSIVTRPVNAFAAGGGITQLSAGHAHMLALKSDGTVLAWGFNQSGQLGHGPFGQASAGPAPVTGLAGATQVSAGWQSSYAVHTVPFLLGS
jgi:alpha-tubulin suppressor-like RCC1 family protein